MVWEIPWSMVKRMLTDLPYQRYLEDDEVDSNGKKKENKALTPQSADSFKNYINQLNEKNKKK